MNYIEIYIKYNNFIDIPSTVMMHSLEKMMNYFKNNNILFDIDTCVNTSPNAFLKYSLKEYVDDMIFERVYDHQGQGFKELIYQQKGLEMGNNSDFLQSINVDGAILTSHERNQLAITSFPSTSHIFESSYETRKTFKITNKIFLNFSTIEYASDKPKKIYKHIYINYHHNSKCDVDRNINIINKCIRSVQSSFNSL